MNRLLAVSLGLLLTASTAMVHAQDHRGRDRAAENQPGSQTDRNGNWRNGDQDRQSRGDGDDRGNRGDGNRGDGRGQARTEPVVTQQAQPLPQNRQAGWTARGGDNNRGDNNRGDNNRGDNNRGDNRGNNGRDFNRGDGRNNDNRGRDWNRGNDNNGRNWNGNGRDDRGRDWNRGNDGRGWDRGRNNDWSHRGWDRNQWRSSWNHGWSGKRYRSSSRYFYPRGYSRLSWSVGFRLPSVYYAPNYYVDYRAYGLAPPPYGCSWVRADNDLLLVDLDTGEVLDALYGFYY